MNAECTKAPIQNRCGLGLTTGSVRGRHVFRRCGIKHVKRRSLWEVASPGNARRERRIFTL